MRLKVLRLPNINMLFQLLLTKFFKSELFSCLPKVDHGINSLKGLINPSILAIGWSYLYDLWHTLLKTLKLLWGEIVFQSSSFPTDNSRTWRLSILYRISNPQNLSQNIAIILLQISLKLHKHIEAAIGGKNSREWFWKNSSQCRERLLQVKKLMASFRCYDNSDVMATLIMTNFHLF